MDDSDDPTVYPLSLNADAVNQIVHIWNSTVDGRNFPITCKGVALDVNELLGLVSLIWSW